MTKLAITAALLAAMGAAQAATYNVTTTWFEPVTSPKNTVFEGSFEYDAATHTVSGLTGQLSEAMTGTSPETMVWVALDHQLKSWHDATLGGTFAAVFKNSTTATFCSTAACGSPADDWSPDTGVAVGGLFAGYPTKGNNAGNAYALIFVPDAPTAALTQTQLDKIAYADCVPTAAGGMKKGGGMMGSVCTTGWAEAGYGAESTMMGYPVSQSITLAAPVPEPESYALMLGGLGLMAAWARRRQTRG